jgi:hypothetical protein
MSRMLNKTLLSLSYKSEWDVSDAVRHTFISGDSGSGKTSGSGTTIRRALLRSGAGGLICVSKPEEAEAVRRDCKMTGRLNDLLEINGRDGHTFNPLAYESARHGIDGTNNVVECAMAIAEAVRVSSGSPGKASEPFWEQSTRMLARYTVPVLGAANDGKVTVRSIVDFTRTAPRSREEFFDDEWRKRSSFYQAMIGAEKVMANDLFEKIASYWLEEFCLLDPKTRGNILASLSTTLDRFNHGWMEKTFCGDSTITPELCYSGKIILLNMPALTMNEDGIIGQITTKFSWMRTMLARNSLPAPLRERLVFLWIDEYQMFASSFDPLFLSACRASMVAVVILTQSLPTLYASMPGEDARAKVDHLIGMCATKIIHSTSCVTTAKWASDLCGRALYQRANFSSGESLGENTGTTMGLGDNWGGNRGWNRSSGTSYQDGKNSSTGGNSSSGSSGGSSWGGSSNWGRSRGSSTTRSTNAGWSEQLDAAIEAADFGRMFRTGGKANGGVVDGLWYQSGRIFAETGTNYLPVSFRQ